MLWRLADLAAARPRRILVIAAIGALLAAAAGGPVASKLDAGRDNFDDPGSQSVVAAAALERAAGGVGVEADLFAVVRSADPAVAARVATIRRQMPRSQSCSPPVTSRSSASVTSRVQSSSQ